jgi:hypothetical protein
MPMTIECLRRPAFPNAAAAAVRSLDRSGARAAFPKFGLALSLRYAGAANHRRRAPGRMAAVGDT